MIKTLKIKSSFTGLYTVFESVLQMRLEEGFSTIKMMIERKANPDDPTFPDMDSDELIPVRVMIKEL